MLCGTLVRESKQPAVPVVFPAKLHPTCMRAHGIANAVEVLLYCLSSTQFSVETMIGTLFPQALGGNQQDKGKKKKRRRKAGNAGN